MSAWVMGGCAGADTPATSLVGPKPTGPQQPAAPVTLKATSMIATTARIQIVPTGSIVPQPPTVIVRDQFGMPIANIAVTFSNVDARVGGVIANFQVVTDTNGVATCGSWTVGSTQGVNALRAAAPGVTALEFDALVVPPDPAGARYDLLFRDSATPFAGSTAWLVLAGDDTYSLTSIWGIGSPSPYVVLDNGTYVRADTTLSFATPAGYVWATGVLQGDLLTLTYEDSLDCGFPCTVVEVYELRQKPTSKLSRAKP